VVSHDRYFLNRVCTDILAFEGDGKIAHSVGDYDYYLEKKQRAEQVAAKQSAAILAANKSSAAAAKDKAKNKSRKLSFKEQRELEGMEAQIHGVEATVARIEALFIQPDFHRKNAANVNQWEELEALRSASTDSKAD